MTALTFEEAFGEFAEIAVSMPPGYAYPRVGTGASLYIDGGFAGPLDAASGRVPDPLTPGCIVAHWLHLYREVPLAALAPLEGKSAAHVLIRLLAGGVLPPDLLNHPSSGQLLKFLQVVQGHQDRGTPWTDALKAAYELVTSPPFSYLLGPDWRAADPVIGDRSVPAPADA